MKTPVLFKTFTYSIAAPAAMTGWKFVKNLLPVKQASLINVNIDFEQENFRLEGDWQYMMASNKYAEKNWFACHKQRVSIEACIYPGLTIDLSDDNNDGLVFIIEGIIKDNDNNGPCSGLLVLDKIAMRNETTPGKWNISFYLYDSAHDDCEIAFRFPVHDRPVAELLN